MVGTGPKVPPRGLGDRAKPWAFLAAWILFLVPQMLQAKGRGGILHRVSRPDETYRLLADRYYGEPFLARHLKAFNRVREPIQVGTTIVIPTYRLVPVRRGQSLSGFAGQYLNDPGRAEYLAELHQLKKREQKVLRKGRRLRVVQSVRHTVRPGESLASIVRTYYRKAGKRRIKLLRLYNQRKSKRLRPGVVLRIPLDTVEFAHRSVEARSRLPYPRVSKKPMEVASASAADPSPKKPDVKARMPPKTRPKGSGAAGPARVKASRPTKPKKNDLRQERALTAAERAYEEGRYQASADLFAQIQREKLPLPKEIKLLKLRAVSLVALGQPAEARALFSEILGLDPEFQLDRRRTSPKVLDIFTDLETAQEQPSK